MVMAYINVCVSVINRVLEKLEKNLKFDTTKVFQKQNVKSS